MPELTPWLIGIGMVALIALTYYPDRRYPGPQEPREMTLSLTFCAWFTWRDGEMCTSGGSYLHDQPCGPVCIGRQRCAVREVKRWGRR